MIKRFIVVLLSGALAFGSIATASEHDLPPVPSPTVTHQFELVDLSIGEACVLAATCAGAIQYGYYKTKARVLGGYKKYTKRGKR